MTAEARAHILHLATTPRATDDAKSLAAVNPALAAEWHPTKNFPLLRL